MDNAFDFAFIARIAAAAGLWIVAATQLGNVTGVVFYDLFAFDDIGKAKAHLAAWGEAKELAGRVFHEIIFFDI